MAKQIGDWNQCRCSAGYQETSETLEKGKCQDCIFHDEKRDRDWKRSCLEFGCPFCSKFDCIGNCETD